MAHVWVRVSRFAMIRTLDIRQGKALSSAAAA